MIHPGKQHHRKLRWNSWIGMWDSTPSLRFTEKVNHHYKTGITPHLFLVHTNDWMTAVRGDCTKTDLQGGGHQITAIFYRESREVCACVRRTIRHQHHPFTALLWHHCLQHYNPSTSYHYPRWRPKLDALTSEVYFLLRSSATQNARLQL